MGVDVWFERPDARAIESKKARKREAKPADEPRPANTGASESPVESAMQLASEVFREERASNPVAPAAESLADSAQVAFNIISFRCQGAVLFSSPLTSASGVRLAKDIVAAASRLHGGTGAEVQHGEFAYPPRAGAPADANAWPQVMAVFVNKQLDLAGDGIMILAGEAVERFAQAAQWGDQRQVVCTDLGQLAVDGGAKAQLWHAIVESAKPA